MSRDHGEPGVGSRQFVYGGVDPSESQSCES